MSSEYELMCIPPEVGEAANQASVELLPWNSKEVYDRVYQRFETCR
jgi:hypothetical protein